MGTAISCMVFQKKIYWGDPLSLQGFRVLDFQKPPNTQQLQLCWLSAEK